MADVDERVTELETQLASLKGTYDSDKATWEADMGLMVPKTPLATSLRGVYWGWQGYVDGSFNSV